MRANIIDGGRSMVLEWGPRLRRWILLSVIAGVPLLFLRATNDPFNTPKLAWLLTTVVIVFLVRGIEISQGATLWGLNRILTPALMMIVPLSVAWVFSPYRYWALFGEYQRYQGLIPYLLIVMLGVAVADAFEGRLRDVAWALAVAGGISGAYAALQFIGMDLFEWANQFGGEAVVTSTLGNSNFAGGFLGIALPVAGGLWLTERDRRALAGWCALATVAGLAATLSQGGWAAGAAGVAVLLGFYLKDRFRYSPAVGAGIAATLLIGMVGLVALQAVRPGSGPGAQTAQLRALWWEGALSMALDDPLVGQGPNAYAVDGWGHRPADDALAHWFDFSNDPHSVYLGVLTSAGVIGLAGFLGVLVWVILQGRRSTDDMLAMGFLGGAVAYATQASVSIDEISLRATFWVLVGAVSLTVLPVVKEREKDKKRRTQSRSQQQRLRLPVIALGLVCLAIAPIYLGARLIGADIGVREAVAAFREGRTQDGIERFESALSFRNEFQYRHLFGFYLGQAAVGEDDLDRELLARADGAFGFLKDFPEVPALRDRGAFLARAAEIDPDLLEEAAESYRRAIEIDPLNVQLVVEGIPLLLRAGEAEALIDLIEQRARLLAPKIPDVWSALSLAHLEAGNQKQAVRFLERAINTYPGDPRVAEIQKQLD